MQEDDIQENEIKVYLKNHPEFFEKNASFLADIHLPSPHGRRHHFACRAPTIGAARQN